MLFDVFSKQKAQSITSDMRSLIQVNMAKVHELYY